MSEAVLGTVLVLSLLAIAPAATAQPAVPLGKPLVEVAEPFTSVSSVRELPDGRVLVVDIGEKSVALVDPARGTVTRVGREGGGPLEYRMPFGLYPRGDSTYLLDVMQRRMLVIGATGEPRGTVPILPSSGVDLTFASRLAIKAMDARGRLYSEVTPMVLDSSTRSLRTSDTALVLRWDAGGVTGDTLLRFWVGGTTSQTSGSPKEGMRLKVPIGAPKSRDQWDLLPDGTIAVVRAADYHVDYQRPDGSKVSGPRIPHTPVPFTSADRERVRSETRSQFEKMRSRMLDMGGPEAAVKLDIEVVEPDRWPNEYPPFGQVRAATDGRLWISMMQPTGSPEVYDVVDRAGKLQARIHLPARTKVVGFGNGVVYAVRMDQDDLQYLQRYRMP